MLDEVDKIGMDFRGDPSSALLEVLDPEQNNTFQDNYLEVPFDLSKVLFIATANLLDPIPPALRDRMEIIQLPGYTEQEKIEIGKRFLIPKQMTNHGLKPKNIEITDEAMTELVQAVHPRGGRPEPRARDRQRHAQGRPAGRRGPQAQDRRRRRRSWPSYLGPQRFEYGELEAEDQIGSATGLVVTEVGGDVVADRGHPDGGQGGLHPHRPAGRGHARVAPAPACRGPGRTPGSWASRARSSRRTRCTSTSRPGPSPRTARRRASRWPSPSSAR